MDKIMECTNKPGDHSVILNKIMQIDLREHHYNANEHCNEKDLRWCEQQYKKKREP